MARTASIMVQLGASAPDFNLPDAVSGNSVTLGDCRGSQGTLIMFICNHCPFVKHVAAQLSKLARDYQTRGIGFVAISANDIIAYPEDGPEQMKAFAQAQQFTFPYLYNETQETAKAYQAVCTPDFFLYNDQLRLAYRGQLDASRPGNDIPVTGADIRQALDALIAGIPVSPNQRPSLGCSIKWKP